MTTRFPADSAAVILGISRPCLEQWVSAGYLPQPTQEGHERRALETMDQLLRLLEARRLGLGDLPYPPGLITGGQAAAWLGMRLAEFRVFVRADDPELEAVPWRHASDWEVAELLEAVEAVTADEDEIEEEVAFIEYVIRQVRTSRLRLSRADRQQARRLVGPGPLFESARVRELARRRARFNPSPGSEQEPRPAVWVAHHGRRPQ